MIYALSAHAVEPLPAEHKFRTILSLIERNYIQPTSIHPTNLLFKSLEHLEDSVPDLQVLTNAEAKHVTLSLCASSNIFPLGNAKTLASFEHLIRDILRFIAKESCFATKLFSSQDGEGYLEELYLASLLSKLDPHSKYFNRSRHISFTMKAFGEFGGIGIALSNRDGEITVEKVLPNSPAERAGIEQEDRLLRVDGQEIHGLSFQEATKLLTGTPESTVVLEILRDEQDVLTLAITREKAVRRAFTSRWLAPGIGYVKIPIFQKNLARDLDIFLRAPSQKAVRALVLDLRDNPGGLLYEATALLELFLPGGELMSILDGRHPKPWKKYSTSKQQAHAMPLVVLINRRSASASELVAAGLKMRARALLLGETTFGKGTVQRLFSFADHTSLKLTVGEFFGPLASTIQGSGVTPHVALLPLRAVPEDLSSGRSDIYSTAARDERRERSLPGFLPSQHSKSSKPETLINYFFQDAPAANEKMLKLAADLASQQDDRRDLLNRFYADELAVISQAFASTGVSWEVSPESGKLPAVEIALETADSPVSGDPAILTSETFTVRISIYNKGIAPLSRYRVFLQSSLPILRREFVFGAIPPGIHVSRTATLTLPRDLTKGLITLSFQHEDLYHQVAPLAERHIILNRPDTPPFQLRASIKKSGQKSEIQLCAEQGTMPNNGRLHLHPKLPEYLEKNSDTIRISEADKTQHCALFALRRPLEHWLHLPSFEVSIRDQDGNLLLKGPYDIKAEKASQLLGGPEIKVSMIEPHDRTSLTALSAHLDLEDPDGLAFSTVTVNGQKKLFFPGTTSQADIDLPLASGLNDVVIYAEDTLGFGSRAQLVLDSP